MENVMRVKISTGSITVSVRADHVLEFDDLFKIHQLATGGHDHLTIESDSKDDVKSDSDENIKDKFSHTDNVSQEMGEPRPDDVVKVAMACPFCGHTESTSALWKHSFTRCPNCHEKLFLRWATDVPGNPDEKGFYYKAETKFHSRYEDEKSDEFAEMFKHSDQEGVPDAYSTVEEIKKYLDSKGVDYSGCRLKGQFLELIKAND